MADQNTTGLNPDGTVYMGTVFGEDYATVDKNVFPVLHSAYKAKGYTDAQINSAFNKYGHWPHDENNQPVWIKQVADELQRLNGLSNSDTTPSGSSAVPNNATPSQVMKALGLGSANTNTGMSATTIVLIILGVVIILGIVGWILFKKKK